MREVSLGKLMRRNTMCEDLKCQFEYDMRDEDLDFTLVDGGSMYLKYKTRTAYKAFCAGYHMGLRG
jgi:hypothetical protein